ncbi:MAG: hypothetical protein QM733_17855 [Ilumatobacteraceae bacterium]
MGDALAVVARVVPDVTGLDKQFDYLVPPALAGDVRPGSSVRVPLHGRRIGGWVVSVGAPSADVPVDRLLPIAAWSGVGPSPDVIDLARWAALRWGVDRLRPFMVAASPPRRVRALPPSRRTVPGSAPTGAMSDEPDRSAHHSSLGATAGAVRRVPPNTDPLPVVVEIARRGPTIVVHPAVAAARAIASRLRRAGLAVALVPDEWGRAAGGVDVVVGTRTAVWAPCPDLVAIVVLDEHDEALQEERTPTWHARDVAIERAARAGAACVLVSPSPTISALAWAGGRLRRPPIAEERASWPLLELVDRAAEEPWKRSLVTGALVRHLREPGRRVVCVHNVAGRSRLLACRACHALLRCERCDAAVAQTDDGMLRCAALRAGAAGGVPALRIVGAGQRPPRRRPPARGAGGRGRAARRRRHGRD